MIFVAETMDENTSDNPREPKSFEDAQRSYLEAVEEIFQEIARGGLALGLSHSELGNVLQDAVIGAAEKNAKRAELNLDRIQSALFSVTAIPRKEIAARQDSKGLRPVTKTIFSSVVSRWIHDAAYHEPESLNEEEVKNLKASLGLKSEIDALMQCLEQARLVITSVKADGSTHYHLLRHAYAGTAAQLTAADDELLQQEAGPEALKLLRRWREDPRHLKPAKLPKRAKNAPSLVGLIEELENELGSARTGATKKFEIRPKSIIEGLLISGLVRSSHDLVGNEAFELAPATYKDFEDFSEEMRWLRTNLTDHLRAAIFNTISGFWADHHSGAQTYKFFEQSIGWRFHQTPEFMEKVRTQIRLELEDGSKTGIGPDALSVIRTGVDQLRKEAPDGPSTHRLRMGVYYYDEPIE